MVADQDSPTGDNNSIGAKGSPITTTVTRDSRMDIGLAKYSNLPRWQPKLTDFIIWHGWMWGRWYGIINGINDNTISVIKEGLPLLLFTMDQSAYEKNTIEIPINKIRNGRNGEYHVLQSGVWYV